ncbi:IS110 family transposase [Deferribacter autotrophicus]|uniref:IS110 family transposase n=1 Tax=Deferribacter autotrophicus TaxID=500465 RepID=A0A5A8F252_9BACT|nr:IS110 family transposase [Deferribacter autotrophicus]KAA0256985.1 IS110 family transposase [Deferribacter autotrophicus]KAA0258981.1 IS110 family transposase [Deferribacter autotrophicus]KAA0259468.1 IS110 family transposase [Deferribacter autotrophicus]
MYKYQKVVGIDVSKLNLSISVYDGKKYSFYEVSNNTNLFKKDFFDKERLDLSTTLFIMENTGVYHLKLATYLVKELGCIVSVVNPLAIKNFIGIDLNRLKTDKADSKKIAEFGYIYGDKYLFSPTDELSEKIELTLNMIDDFYNQINTLSNQLESLMQRYYKFPEIIKSYKSMIKTYQRKIREAEKELERLIKKNFKVEYELLRSIPGAGLKFCSLVIGKLKCFKNFDKAKQVSSYIGICPSPYESGSSIKGRGKISKRGNTYMRKILFMCSLSACKHNRSCRTLYYRLIASGKPKKLALIAVANKLIRQAFGILKSGKPYDPDYHAGLTHSAKNA